VLLMNGHPETSCEGRSLDYQHRDSRKTTRTSMIYYEQSSEV
jgi:hypothetical protein